MLVIGNRNYSSWSLRPWIFLRHNGVEFEEIRLPLDTDEFRQRIVELSPSRRVPVLLHGGKQIWESLAICEYAAESFTGVRGWPEEPAARSEARSIACEMHAGFAAMRHEMPMNCRALGRQIELSAEARRDVERVEAIWHDAVTRHGSGGPWLFGDFCIADAMFAPVAVRFRAYGIQPRDAAGEWMRSILSHPAMIEWMEAAAAEPEVIEAEEVG